MKFALSMLMLATGLTFVGCNDSVYDEQADAVRERSQEYADNVREQADNTAEQVEDRYEAAKPALEESADETADAIEAQGEEKADAIEVPANVAPINWKRWTTNRNPTSASYDVHPCWWVCTAAPLDPPYVNRHADVGWVKER